MSLFRKKSDVPEEQALLAAMDDMRNRPRTEPGIEDVRDPGDDDSDVVDDDLDGGDSGSERAGASGTDESSPRINFGSLKVPAFDGMQLRVELDPQENPIAVSIMLDETVLQLQAFAAPKSEHLWDEVRQEIAEGIRGAQGKAREAEGPFGRELQAEVVVTDQKGKTMRQDARFIGVDGERWFLRGVVTGPGATKPENAAAVEQIFGSVEVERGEYAAAPRDPLKITMPDEPSLVAEGETGGAEGEGTGQEPTP